LDLPTSARNWRPFAVTHLGRLLLPGSDFLQELAAAPLPAGVRLTAIYSRHDNMVIPFEAAQMEGAGNVELSGMGHLGLLYHPLAFEALCDALTEETP
jgi:triacylglycerol lipase